MRLSLIILCLPLLVSCATSSKQPLKDADYYYKIGLSYLNEGNIKQAYIDFQKAIELDPKHKEALNSLGLVYIRLEDFDKAQELFNRALTLDSNFSDAFNNLGIVYMHKKKWQDAIIAFRQALKNPLYHSADLVYLNIGYAQYRARNYDEAIKAFKQAILRNPELVQAIYALALAYNKAGNYGMSASAFKQAIDKDPRYSGDIQKFIAELKQKLPFAIDEEEEDLEDLLEITNY